MYRNRMKKFWLISVIAAVLAVAICVCWTTNVFGKFTPQEPYVEGEAESLSSTVVTSVGSNWQGEMGTGAKPCSEEVPTCVGKKGSETNPFVVLEIVADKAQQQLAYLAMEEDSVFKEDSKPLDIMKIGIERAQKAERRYVPGNNHVMTHEELEGVGKWFSTWQFKVNPFGEETDIKEEDMIDEYFLDIEKLYSLKITSEDLEKAGIDEGEFDKQWRDSRNEELSNVYQGNNGVYNIESLMKKYPALFEKDSKKRKIRKIAKEDSINWDTSVVEDVKKYTGKGYILAVAPGEGEFGFASQDDCNNWVFRKTGTKADRWIYVENEEDLPEESVIAYKNNSARLRADGFWDNNKQMGYQSCYNLYANYNESDDITGLYMNLADNSWITIQYKVNSWYQFDYYGIRNHNILKGQLFQFKTQEDYDNFHLEVVCMTPSELNALAKKDTDETVDMIERADMFYIGGYDQSTYTISDVYNLYHKYVLGDTDYEFDETKIAGFADDDLEWDLCYKLIYRLCNNRNLPLIVTNTVGKLVEEGTESIPMYQSAQNPYVDRMATLSNLGKLYIVSTQFDLTAKKAEDETYLRTFYDDILVPGKLQKIALAEGAKNTTASPAQYTGYYERPKVIFSEDKMAREKCYYLWNTLTFFPEALEDLWYNADQMSIDYDRLEAYGYMRSYFEVDDPAKIFSSNSEALKVNASDGSVGNVGIPHNARNGGYSTLLGNTESAYVTNHIMNVAYQIMNKRPEVVNPQIVKVMKQKQEYVKMSDNAVLLDYSSDQSYGEKRTYLKVQIHNNNNGEAGVVTKITLKNGEGQRAPVDEELLLYSSKNFATECEKATYGIYTGYKIPNGDTLIAYVPYSLQQWAEGYNIIEFETVGRIYSQKKKKIVIGNPMKTEVSIGERTLFNLE